MEVTKRDARRAGFLYLSLMTAPFSLFYVPNKIIVHGDAIATTKNLAAHETLFRLGASNELLSTVLFIFVLFALYKLLRGVNETQARMMAIFGLLSVPIAFIGVAADLASLSALKNPDLAYALIRLHGTGILVSEIFWGLWLFPFAALIIKSGFIPKIFGFLLILNGCAYIIAGATSMLSPANAATVNSWMMVPETGELWIMLWLIVKGISVTPIAIAQPSGAMA